MLVEIESLINKELSTNDVKILVMISRDIPYVQIAVKVGINTGAVKTRVKRLKDKCGAENIRDLMKKKYL